jgi:alanine-synthesizing transaminase
VLGEGESVVVGSPTYPAHAAAVALAGGRKVPWLLEADAERAAQSLQAVLQSSGSRVVLLNVPSNPSGLVVDAEWWRAIGEVCSRFGATVINDFVYGEMCFSGMPAQSALVMAAQGVSCVEVYSLSKSHNIPGWRVGALLGDARILSAVARLKAHSDYGLFLPLQHAAAFALTTPDDLVRPTVATYDRRIKLLSSGLKRVGWTVSEAKAGACVWAKFPAELGQAADSTIASRSVAVAHMLLTKHAVLVSPGVMFGDAFDDHIRFAAVVSEERIRDVISALS